MNELIAALFIIALIFISTAGREFEAERDTTVRVECTDWEKIAKSATEGLNFKEGMKVIDSLWNVIQRIDNEWELIRYEGNCLMGVEYGDSIMVKKK